MKSRFADEGGEAVGEEEDPLDSKRTLSLNPQPYTLNP